MLLKARRAGGFAALMVLLASCSIPGLDLIGGGPTASGPEIGTLVIAGGGDLTGTGIVERFLELAGGVSAPIVVIPTADGDPSYTHDWSGLEPFQDAGASNITILHTYDRRVANSEAFVEPLRRARAVWFPGGRPWRLADAYLGTRTHRELMSLLARGGVIGGSSAGASIQASYLVRGAEAGNHIVMAPDHEQGFGFLRNSAIDQHLIVRRREKALAEVVERHPELLGIGIDEGTAIVVQGNDFEVIGRSRVAIYDGSDLTEASGYYFLAAGDRYDMEEKKPAISHSPC